MLDNNYFDENEFMLGEEAEDFSNPGEELKEFKKYFKSKKNKFKGRRLYIAG